MAAVGLAFALYTVHDRRVHGHRHGRRRTALAAADLPAPTPAVTAPRRPGGAALAAGRRHRRRRGPVAELRQTDAAAT